MPAFAGMTGVRNVFITAHFGFTSFGCINNSSKGRKHNEHFKSRAPLGPRYGFDRMHVGGGGGNGKPKYSWSWLLCEEPEEG
jgi:hypothetical protein